MLKVAGDLESMAIDQGVGEFGRSPNHTFSTSNVQRSTTMRLKDAPLREELRRGTFLIRVTSSLMFLFPGSNSRNPHGRKII
jgi:hypothetical protein